MCHASPGSSWSRIKSRMIRHPKYRPYPPGFLVKPGMTRFLTPDSPKEINDGRFQFFQSR